MRKMSKKVLETIEIKINEVGGFTLWVNEKDKKGKVRSHWILDASCFREDGEIRLGNSGIWKHGVVFNENEKSLKFITDAKGKD